MSTDSDLCPKCGQPLPPEAPRGLCPACLMAAAMETEPLPASAMPAPEPEMLTKAFPHLEILEPLGVGGMGRVYKVRQPHLERIAALKILPPALASDPGWVERFHREARALARLNHPHIVQVYDFGEATSVEGRPPLPYLLMEFVDGVNLRQAMQAGTLTAREALAIVPKLCDALQYAHERGVLHRDLKPENILMDGEGRVKMADFGLVKFLHKNSDQASAMLTQTGLQMGTAAYMAPEQIEHPQDVDHRADIYSLGVVFYEMLTGGLPLGRFPAPSESSGVDPRLDGVVFRTLEKQREKRYQSAGEVKTGLEHVAGAPSTTSRAVQPLPKSRALKWTLGCLIAVAVLTLSGLAIPALMVLYWRTQARTETTQVLEVVPANSLDTVGTKILVERFEFDDGSWNRGLRLRCVQGAVMTVAQVDTGDSFAYARELACTANVRCENLPHGAHLELWAETAEGEHFSVKSTQELRGTQDWRDITISMPLDHERIISRLYVNVVAEGEGIVWISDITIRDKTHQGIVGVFHCTDLAQVKTKVSLDKVETRDGNGSIKVETPHGAVITVADKKGLSVGKDHTLWCTIWTKCANVSGKAYLEMWCEMPDGSRAFSKGLHRPLGGDMGWQEIRLPMVVNADTTITRAIVNVVMEGSGSVWVDEIQFSEQGSSPTSAQASAVRLRPLTPPSADSSSRINFQAWVDAVAQANDTETRDKALSTILNALKSQESTRVLAGLGAVSGLQSSSFEKWALREGVRPHLDSAQPDIRSAAISALMSSAPEPVDEKRILDLMPGASKGDCSALAAALAKISKLDLQGENGETMLKLVDIGVAAALEGKFDEWGVLGPLRGAKLSPALESRIIELTKNMNATKHDPSMPAASRVGYSAFYFVLCTQANKSEASVERLLELSKDPDVMNVAGYCLLALGSGVQAEVHKNVAASVARHLEEHPTFWNQGMALLEMYAQADQLPLLKALASRKNLSDAQRERLQNIIASKQDSQ